MHAKTLICLVSIRLIKQLLLNAKEQCATQFVSFVVAMPNGATSYRVSSGQPRSPDHTSDSDQTSCGKYEYKARCMRALPSHLRNGAIGRIVWSFLHIGKSNVLDIHMDKSDTDDSDTDESDQVVAHTANIP